MTFKELSQRFNPQKLQKKMFQALLTKAAQRWITETITTRLSQKGETPDGRLRTDRAKKQSNVAYSDYTMLLKREKNQPIDKVTLKDTGDFHKSFKTVLRELELKVRADFQKGDEHIGENFLTDYFPDEFEIEVTSLTESEITELLKKQYASILQAIHPN